MNEWSIVAAAANVAMAGGIIIGYEVVKRLIRKRPTTLLVPSATETVGTGTFAADLTVTSAANPIEVTRQPRYRMNVGRNMRRGHERFRLAVVDTANDGKTVLVDATSWPSLEKAEELRASILSGKIGYGIIVEGEEKD